MVPLTFKIVADNDGNNGSAEVGFEINQSNADVHFWINTDMITDGSPLKIVGDLSIAGNNEPVSVEEPPEATGVYELLGLFLGSSQLLPTAEDLEGLSPEEIEQLQKYIGDLSAPEDIEL